jgi:CMP-N-acetylneuraminic acid synthetase
MSRIGNNRVVALVPMRHHSERVPGKNYRPLAGKPLYAHILQTLLSCPDVEAVVVDTDSPVIQEGIARSFPGVVMLERPAHLRAGETSTNAVLMHDVTMVEAPWYLQTHCTNPFLRPATIGRAIQRFMADLQSHDALFSVTRYQKRLWDASGRPVNHDPHLLLRTQDLSPLFEENSCIYLFERQAFLRAGNRLCERPQLFEIDGLEAWDIDEEQDFTLAETLAATLPRPGATRDASA